MKKLILVFLLSISVRTEAANLVRVLEIRDDASIVVERNGARATVRLAGIEITDLRQTTSLLRWTIGSSWVMLEGDAVVSIYRSPDAMFVNRELVVRGFARATSPDTEAHRALPVTYLGELDLGPREPAAKSTASSRRSSPAPQTNRSTSRRSRGSRRRAP